jgi:hypothetical protein
VPRKRKPKLTAKQLFARNLAEIIKEDGREEADIAMELELGATPGVAASNLRKYLRAERWPGEPMFDAMAIALGIERSRFFQEPVRARRKA